MTLLRRSLFLVLLLGLFAGSGVDDAFAARVRKAAPAPVPAQPPMPPAPPVFSAHYVVDADGFKVGEMERALKPLGNNTYLIETRVFTTGLVSLFKPDEYVERSVWRLEPGGHVPLEFTSRYTGRSKDVKESLHFDWEAKTVRSVRDGKEKVIEIAPGVLDKLMYQAVLQYDLSRGVTQFRYRVADRGKIEKYAMDVIGEETIDTVLGEQRSIKVKKGTTTFWCAVGLDYLPVKLEQREDGHVVGTRLTKLTREPPADPPPAAP